ncbi:Zinc finger CCCH domain-containing protein 32 [Platanthera guangdongensis]|uniref:Zinc finger CCCH domain-containing protein 32 n=1 Tax=Platanthera guangdongensis TaxID=2320717 RepID=A0ABR2N345_9ASPA
MGGWQFGGSSSALSGAYMPSSYGPIMIQPGVIPLPSWNPYLWFDKLGIIGRGSFIRTAFAVIFFVRTKLPGSLSFCNFFIRPSSSAQREHNFPQRPVSMNAIIT